MNEWMDGRTDGRMVSQSDRERDRDWGTDRQREKESDIGRHIERETHSGPQREGGGGGGGGMEEGSGRPTDPCTLLPPLSCQLSDPPTPPGSQALPSKCCTL